MKYTKSITLSLCAIATLFASPLSAETTVVENAVQATENGELVGKVFASVEGEAKPVNAKLTLTSEGVVVDSVIAEEDGSFSFPNVEPGSYQLIGSSDGFVGGQVVSVQPAGTVGSPSVSFGLNAPSTVVPGSVVYGAPATAATPSSLGAGVGSGAGLGRFMGFRPGGGLFSSSPLVSLGVVGGIIGVAVSGDDDDATPSN